MEPYAHDVEYTIFECVSIRISASGLAVKLKTARVSASAMTTSLEIPENVPRRRGTNQTQTALQRLQIQELLDHSSETKDVANSEPKHVTNGVSHMIGDGREQTTASAESGHEVPEPRLTETHTVVNAHVVAQNLHNKPLPSLLTENLIKKAIKEALEEYNGQSRTKSPEEPPPHVTGRLDKGPSFFYPYKRRFFKNMAVCDKASKCW